MGNAGLPQGDGFRPGLKPPSTPYELTFELFGLPTMSNLKSGRSHWRYADAERKRWQQAVCLLVGAKKPAIPLKRAQLTLTRYSSVEPDYDGLARGFKSVVDGLVLAGVLENDKLSNTGVWDCRWVKCAQKAGKIHVHVREDRKK